MFDIEIVWDFFKKVLSNTEMKPLIYEGNKTRRKDITNPIAYLATG